MPEGETEHTVQNGAALQIIGAGCPWFGLHCQYEGPVLSGRKALLLQTLVAGLPCPGISTVVIPRRQGSELLHTGLHRARLKLHEPKGQVTRSLSFRLSSSLPMAQPLALLLLFILFGLGICAN